MTEFWLDGRGYYRCKRCRMERVSRRRRKMKLILVEEAGGRCVPCGYNRRTAALHFHHVDPASKQFHLSMQGVTRPLRQRELRWQSACRCVPTLMLRWSWESAASRRMRLIAQWPKIPRPVPGSSTGRALDC
jgi:hypothetical protein